MTGCCSSLPLVIQCQSDSCLNIVWLAVVSFPAIAVVVVLRKGNAFADQRPNRISIQDIVGMIDLINSLLQTLGDDFETFLPTSIVIRFGSGDSCDIAAFWHAFEGTCPFSRSGRFSSQNEIIFYRDAVEYESIDDCR